MSITLVELHDVSPDEIPYDAHSDEAVDLANDIYNLIQEEYSFDVSGVSTVVDQEVHKEYMKSDE